MMQMEPAQFSRLLEVHREVYPFARRYPVTTFITLLTDLGLTTKSAYFTIQYTLTVLLGLTFYRYLLTMGFHRVRAHLGLFLFLTSYPILAAHIAPIHNWDDLWTHLFMILSFTDALTSKPGRSIIWFTVACFAREQSFILLPALIFVMRLTDQRLSRRRLVTIAATPILVYGIFLVWDWHAPRFDRLTLIVKNFANPLRASDTLYSLFISFGFAWVTTLIGLTHRGRSSTGRLLFWGTVLSLPATVIFTLFLTNARETRIFFPPFLFVIPICLMVVRGIYDNLRAKVTGPEIAWVTVIAVLLMGVGITLGYLAFPEFEYRQCPNFHRQWAGVHFGLILCLMAYTLRWGWKDFVMGYETKSNRPDSQSLS
ncbi:MAG: hypothetical protein JSV52_12745 [Candidatus Zixiibacteriota bacterium]|nr:MAG: hypothetical protein JSV52_12745 [candidate division Zixibacteria bacterium]